MDSDKFLDRDYTVSREQAQRLIDSCITPDLGTLATSLNWLKTNLRVSADTTGETLDYQLYEDSQREASRCWKKLVPLVLHAWSRGRGPADPSETRVWLPVSYISALWSTVLLVSQDLAAESRPCPWPTSLQPILDSASGSSSFYTVLPLKRRESPMIHYLVRFEMTWLRRDNSGPIEAVVWGVQQDDPDLVLQSSGRLLSSFLPDFLNRLGVTQFNKCSLRVSYNGEFAVQGNEAHPQLSTCLCALGEFSPSVLPLISPDPPPSLEFATFLLASISELLRSIAAALNLPLDEGSLMGKDEPTDSAQALIDYYWLGRAAPERDEEQDSLYENQSVESDHPRDRDESRQSRGHHDDDSGRQEDSDELYVMLAAQWEDEGEFGQLPQAQRIYNFILSDHSDLLLSLAKRNRQARRQQHSETEDQQGAEEQQDPEEQQEADEQQDAEEQGGQTGLGAQDATTAMSLDLIATSCFPRAFQSSGEAEFPVSAFENPFDHHSPFLGDLRDPLWHKRWQSGQSSQAQKLTLSQPATNAETRDFTTEGDIDSFTFVAPLPLPLRPYGHLALSLLHWRRLDLSQSFAFTAPQFEQPIVCSISEIPNVCFATSVQRLVTYTAVFPGLYVGPKPKTRRPRASQPADEDADEYVPPDAARQWSVELTDQQKQAWDSITEQAADKAFANLRSYLPTTRHKAKARWANLKLDWNQQLPPAEVKQWSNNILEAFRQQTADALILGGSCYFYINGKALKYVSRNDSAEGCVKGLGDAAVELDLQALVPSNNAASPQNSWQCSFDVAVQYSVGNQYTTWRISALQDALSQFGGRFLSDASRMPMHLTYDLGGVQSNTSSWVEKTLGVQRVVAYNTAKYAAQSVASDESGSHMLHMSDAALVASLNARDSRRALKSGLDIEDRFRSMRLAAHELSITRREARIEMRVSGVEGALALLKHLFEPERLQFFLDRACLAVISPKAVGAMILGHCISMQLMFRSCDLSDAVSRVVLLYIRFTFNGLMSSSLRYANYRQERAMLELQGGEASFRQRGMLLGKFFWVKNGKTVVSIGIDRPTGDQQAHTEANAARLECLEDSLQQYYQGRGLKTTTPRSQQPQNVERPVELPVFSQSVRKRLIRQKYREGRFPSSCIVTPAKAMAKFFSGVVLHLLASMTPGLSPEGVRLGSTSQQKLVEDVNKACKKARDVRDLQVVFNQHLTAARLRAAYGTAIEIQVVPETSLLLRRHHLFESYFPENSRKDNTMADRREDFKGALGSSQYVHSFIQDSLGSSHFLQVQARTEARNVFFSLSLLWPSLHTSQRTNPEERQYRPLVRKRDGRFQFGMLGEVHSTKASHEPRTTAQVASETEPARQQEASDTEMEPRDATEGEAPFRRLASPTHEQYLAAEAQAGNSRQEPQAQASSLQNAPETVHRAGGRRKGQKKKRKRK